MLPVELSLMIVVPEAERLVKPFREKYDPSAAVGVPAHITLLYPFKPPAEINETVLDNLNQCFAHFQPSPVRWERRYLVTTETASDARPR